MATMSDAEMIAGVRAGRGDAYQQLGSMASSPGAPARRAAALLVNDRSGLADALLGPFARPDAATAIGAGVWPEAQRADAELAAGPPYSSSNFPEFGAVVRLCGLRSRPECNGLLGTVTPRGMWPASGRVLVQVEDGDVPRPMAVKPDNIKRADGQIGPNVSRCVAVALGVCSNLAAGMPVDASTVEAARVAVAKRLGPVLSLLVDDRRTLFGSRLLWRDVFYLLCASTFEHVLDSGENMSLQGGPVPPTAKRLLIESHGDVVRRAVVMLLFNRPPDRPDGMSITKSALASGVSCLMELVEPPPNFNKGRGRLDGSVALCKTPLPDSSVELAEALPGLVASMCADPTLRISAEAWECVGYAYDSLYWGGGGDARLVNREAAAGFAAALKTEITGEQTCFDVTRASQTIVDLHPRSLLQHSFQLALERPY